MHEPVKATFLPNKEQVVAAAQFANNQNKAKRHLTASINISDDSDADSEIQPTMQEPVHKMIDENSGPQNDEKHELLEDMFLDEVESDEKKTAIEEEESACRLALKNYLLASFQNLLFQASTNCTAASVLSIVHNTWRISWAQPSEIFIASLLTRGKNQMKQYSHAFPSLALAKEFVSLKQIPNVANLKTMCSPSRLRVELLAHPAFRDLLLIPDQLFLKTLYVVEQCYVNLIAHQTLNEIPPRQDSLGHWRGFNLFKQQGRYNDLPARFSNVRIQDGDDITPLQQDYKLALTKRAKISTSLTVEKKL